MSRDRGGYCPHGVYVGGVGIDWMCGRCEAGDDRPPARAVVELELSAELVAALEYAGVDGWTRALELAVAALPGIEAARTITLELGDEHEPPAEHRTVELGELCPRCGKREGTEPHETWCRS